MIQTAPLSRTTSLPLRSQAPQKTGESSDFAVSFAQVGDDAEPETLAAATDDAPRQDDAETGNVLPLPTMILDPALVWQPIVAPPSPAAATPIQTASMIDTGATIATTGPVAATAPTTAPVFAQLQAQAAAPAADPQPVSPAPALASGTPMTQLAAAIMAALPPTKPATPTPADTVQTEAPTTDAPRWTTDTPPVTLALAQPEMVQPQPGTVASAATVFGAAIQAATKRDEADTPAAPSDTPLTPVGATATHEIKVADAQQAPLDMRQERWPHAMIERIEMLRDAADAVDTRIRLVPDALGAIDVSVKTEGDTVRVHFNAEQAATRTLLADAQPRLAELAEARGLKLAQGSLGDGGAQQQRAPATPHIPNRPASASAVIADTATDDIRIA